MTPKEKKDVQTAIAIIEFVNNKHNIVAHTNDYYLKKVEYWWDYFKKKEKESKTKKKKN